MTFSLLSIPLGTKFLKEAKESLDDRKQNFTEAEELESKLLKMQEICLKDDASLLALSLAVVYVCIWF